MWVTIRRIVFDQLTEQQKAEWGLLSGLMAVSKGGRLLDLSHDNKRKEEIQEGPQLQGAPTITNHSDTRPIIKISAPSAHLTHESNEYPDRPGNFPRVRPQQTMIITALDPTIASLQERVHQLEIESKSEGRSWLGNRGAFARRLSLGLWENEESEFTESECSEDSDETYADEVKQQANNESNRLGGFLNASHGVVGLPDWRRN
ncbi:hypothetical protein EV426DRAFT_603313 [Tirmania nivea]|nr:hypothetical protein EV426DRAFT_603313 [Tirmania nivea]